jgi:hypothetical protein
MYRIPADVFELKREMFYFIEQNISNSLLFKLEILISIASNSKEKKQTHKSELFEHSV